MSEADSSLVSHVSLSLVFIRRFAGLTALSRRIPGRDDADEWNVGAGRVEDDEWKVEVTPPRREAAGGIPLSDSEPESMRVLRGRDLEDDTEGGDMGFSKSDDSACGMVGGVYDEGDSDSTDDSSMRPGWMRMSESEDSMCELRGRVGTDGASESSDGERRWKDPIGPPSLDHPPSDSEESARIEFGRWKGRRGSGDVRADRLFSRLGERLRSESTDE